MLPNSWKPQLPGYNYCGLGGDASAAPINSLDYACQTHDNCYGVIKAFGKNPYTHWNYCDEDLLEEIYDMEGKDARIVRQFFNAKHAIAPNLGLQPITPSRPNNPFFSRAVYRKRKAVNPAGNYAKYHKAEEPMEMDFARKRVGVASYYKMPRYGKRKRFRRGRRRFRNKRSRINKYTIAKAIAPLRHLRSEYQGYMISNDKTVRWHCMSIGHSAWLAAALARTGAGTEAMSGANARDRLYFEGLGMKFSFRNMGTQPMHFTVFKCIAKGPMVTSDATSVDPAKAFLDQFASGVVEKIGTTPFGASSAQILATSTASFIPTRMDSNMIHVNLRDSGYTNKNVRILSTKHYIFPPGAQMVDSLSCKKRWSTTLDELTNTQLPGVLPGKTIFYVIKQRGFELCDLPTNTTSVAMGKTAIAFTGYEWLKVRATSTEWPIIADQQNLQVATIAGNLTGPSLLVETAEAVA